MTLFEKAPAKINLSLDVISKREDGYHNVEMIMTTIDLSDHIELTPLEDDKIVLSLESRYVPSDERNLAYQAAEAFKKKYGIKRGVHIRIEKHIPVSAGLGGGNSDAATCIRGLNKIWNLNIPAEELAKLGASLGADVSFCIYGNTAIARGYGEQIEKLVSPPPCWVVLAKPDIGVSTRNVFARVDLEKIHHPKTEKVIEALEEKDFYKLCSYISNSLEPITGKMHPEVLDIKETMIKMGAPGVMMSGSGPTVFGLVENERQAKRIYNGMRGFCDEVYLVRLTG